MTIGNSSIVTVSLSISGIQPLVLIHTTTNTISSRLMTSTLFSLYSTVTFRVRVINISVMLVLYGWISLHNSMILPKYY